MYDVLRIVIYNAHWASLFCTWKMLCVCLCRHKNRPFIHSMHMVVALSAFIFPMDLSQTHSLTHTLKFISCTRFKRNRRRCNGRAELNAYRFFFSSLSLFVLFLSNRYWYCSRCRFAQNLFFKPKNNLTHNCDIIETIFCGNYCTDTGSHRHRHLLIITRCCLLCFCEFTSNEKESGRARERETDRERKKYWNKTKCEKRLHRKELMNLNAE